MGPWVFLGRLLISNQKVVVGNQFGLIKTIVFEIKDKGWILAVVTGHDRIDYKLLARACDTNRKQIRSVAPETVERELGFEVGGIGPFPIDDSVNVIVDESLVDIGMIFCGSGRNTETIEMKMADLISLINPFVCRIKKV